MVTQKKKGFTALSRSHQRVVRYQLARFLPSKGYTISCNGYTASMEHSLSARKGDKDHQSHLGDDVGEASGEIENIETNLSMKLPSCSGKATGNFRFKTPTYIT